ncbi:hypothetical protein ACLOJK_016763 [Asimina triloba]
MYMAYGWPSVIPLQSGLCPSTEQIIYLKITNRLLLVVGPTHLELWSSSQHKVRLGKYMREADSVLSEGENLQAIWSPDTKLIAVVTSSFFLHIFRVQVTDKKILIGGKQPTGLFLVSISLVLSEKTPFSDGNLTMYGLPFGGSFELEGHPCGTSETTEYMHSMDNGSSTTEVGQSCAIIHLELSLQLRLLVVLFSDGPIALCSTSKKGLKQKHSINTERWLSSGDAVCTAIASDRQILAVGCRRGVVELYDLAENTSLLRTVSLYDWGYSMEDTGPVSCIAWAPDGNAFAVGWKYRGLTVWSVSGCRLMCTIRQIGVSSASSPMVKPNHDFKCEPLMGGTSLVQWDEYGYRLYAIEESSSERILVFSFGKCCLNRGISGTTYVRQVIYSEDRVLVVQSEETDELKILHLNLPVSYISQNWPILHVVASKDGMFLAVAGLHGLILYDIHYKKWRVYELLFYPRYHLDQSSLLYRKRLLGEPVVMDVFQDYILVTYHPFDVRIFHVKIFGELSPSSTPFMELSTVRELSIMTAKSHPAAMRFIPDPLPRESENHINSTSDSITGQPTRCLILRTNGELSVLDLDDGHEQELADSVELVWVTCGQSEEKANLIEEVWYPSPGVDPFKQEDFLQLDPELEFDREVYPLGLLPNAGVVVGVSQRMSFSACTEFPCFEPSPQAQTILHCLLRHLLQRDKNEEALRLANLSAEKPHFSHCLEWLLFTVFDAEISRQNANRNQASIPQESGDSSLLEKTCDLIRNFPEYVDVVVCVARKTDGRHWADLFSAAGRSTEYVLSFRFSGEACRHHHHLLNLILTN